MTIATQFLTGEERKTLDRLQKARTTIMQEHSALTAKHATAVSDLEKARGQHSNACVALASGDRQADPEACAAEVRRLEALIGGYTQLINAKNAELSDIAAQSAPLHEKHAWLANQAERARLEENLNRKVERLAQLKEDLRQAENDRTMAALELGNFMRQR